MAFCNTCGTNIESGAKFCPKCGASQPGVTPAAAGASPPPAASSVPISTPQGASSPGTFVNPPQGSLKPILLVVGAVVVVGALAIAGLTVFGLHLARRTHVENRDGNVRVEIPGVSVESTTDPSNISRDLGVDLYPNAHLLKGNAQNVSIAGMHAVSAQFETDDPPDKVADFYKAKLPNAQHASAGDRYSIISTEKNNIITIKIESSDGKTLIHVANVSGKGVTGASSD
jgi:zinc-ribbon domain